MSSLIHLRGLPWIQVAERGVQPPNRGAVSVSSDHELFINRLSKVSVLAVPYLMKVHLALPVLSPIPESSPEVLFDWAI